MRILMINPWIYDFAAYDLWAKPIGFLYLASILKNSGIDVDFLDTLDRHHPLVADLGVKDKKWGTGKYYDEKIPKPLEIAWMRRKYKRYGIPLEYVEAYFSHTQKPDIIFITTRMTYWYRSVSDMVDLCRKYFGGAPIILGGTYVTLMPEHAKRHINADFFFSGEAELSLGKIISKFCGSQIPPLPHFTENLDTYPFPAHELCHNKDAFVVMTSRGCPMSCYYCASKIVSKNFRRRSIENVLEEINMLGIKYNAKNIAFYDDALLFDCERYFKPLIREYLKSPFPNLHFHLPNGISCSFIDDELALLLKAAQFETIRLSLESVNPERLRQLNRKGSPDDFIKAINSLRKAGFTEKEVGVYLLTGLPGQGGEEIDEAMKISIDNGAIPKLAEYSPIPGTALWQSAIDAVKFDISDEPLYHNCSVYFHLLKDFDPCIINRLRNKYKKNS